MSPVRLPRRSINPIHEICRAYGIQERRVYQVLQEQGIKRPKSEQRRPLSGLHEKIGGRLYEYYFAKAIAATVSRRR